jgi:hypothetical protein
MMLRVVRTAFMLAVIAGVGEFVMVPVVAASDEPEFFMTHVHFEEMHSLRRKAIDPQVFVREKQDFRPARRGDDPSSPLYTAQGGGLSLNLGHWFGASGTARFLNGPGVPIREVRFSFTGLVPFGVYSIFVSRSTPDTVEIAPFAKATESLKASVDGSLALATTAEIPLLDGDLVWLVYHSDIATHGNRLGELGVTAHEQLILPVRLSPPAKPSAPAKEPVRATLPPPPTPTLSPSPSLTSSPSPFPTLPSQPVTMVSQSDATPSSSRATAPAAATATASPTSDDEDLYVPLDRVSTPAPTGQPAPAPSATLTPAPAESATPRVSATPVEPATPVASAAPAALATPIESMKPEEEPSPMPSEPTF